MAKKGEKVKGYERSKTNQLLRERELSIEQMVKLDGLLASQEIKKRAWLLKEIKKDNLPRINAILFAYGILTDKNRLSLDRLQGKGEIDLTKLLEGQEKIERLMLVIERGKSKETGSDAVDRFKGSEPESNRLTEVLKEDKG